MPQLEFDQDRPLNLIHRNHDQKLEHWLADPPLKESVVELQALILIDFKRYDHGTYKLQELTWSNKQHKNCGKISHKRILLLDPFY